MQETCLIPELGRSPGGETGNPLQYACLGKPMVRGAWQSAVHGVTKSETHIGTQHLNSSHSPRKTWQGSEGGKERESDPHKLAMCQQQREEFASVPQWNSDDNGGFISELTGEQGNWGNDILHYCHELRLSQGNVPRTSLSLCSHKVCWHLEGGSVTKRHKD